MHKAKLAISIKEIHLIMDIASLLFFIFWLTHVVACLFYTLGKGQENSDTNLTWLSNDHYRTSGASYAYWTALHWSVTQITPGSMEVVPKSSGERAFNVVVLFAGL